MWYEDRFSKMLRDLRDLESSQADESQVFTLKQKIQRLREEQASFCQQNKNHPLDSFNLDALFAQESLGEVNRSALINLLAAEPVIEVEDVTAADKEDQRLRLTVTCLSPRFDDFLKWCEE